MNTRRLVFGFLAMVTLVASALSTTVTIDPDQELGIDRKIAKKQQRK